jgi:hypothetical protein
MNKWFHLMLVLENNTLNIFVNGQDKTSLATVTGTISTMPSLLNGAYKNYMLGYYNSTTYSWQGSLVHVAQWDSDKSSDISTIYNNGKPGDLTSLSPKNWWKLIDGSLVDSGSEADNAVALSTLPTIVATNVNSNSNPGTSLGMTEANLIDENVSVVNGESDTLPASALVQSDLTRKLPFANPFSISLWFKYTGGTRVLVTKQETASASTQVVYIYTNAGNILWYGGGVSPSATSSGGLSDGNWHHAVFVAESDTVARIYIDGVDDTADIAKDRIGTGSNTGSIILGTNYNKDNFFFNGEMSNAAIWTSALTPEEILDLYNNGIPTNLNTSFTPGPPNYWWPMDEDYTYFNGSVLVARDAVGSNDGTGVNIIQENIVGNAPGSEANGIGTNLTITDLKGDMKSSINNSYSINMADYADGVTNPANSGRSTNVP